jgi:hypothetical protein
MNEKCKHKYDLITETEHSGQAWKNQFIGVYCKKCGDIIRYREPVMMPIKELVNAKK